MLDSDIPIYPIELRPKGGGCTVCTRRLSPGANFWLSTAPPERGDRCSRFIAKREKSRFLFWGRLPWRLIPFHSPAALLERVLGFGISRWRRESKNHCDDGKRT